MKLITKEEFKMGVWKDGYSYLLTRTTWRFLGIQIWTKEVYH